MSVPPAPQGAGARGTAVGVGVAGMEAALPCAADGESYAETVDEAVLVRDLRFVYRDAEQPALRSVDLDVRPGELVAVMGPSGAGKSTLCQALNGLVPHFTGGELTGAVEVGGKVVAEHSVAGMAEAVGLVFQDFEAQLFSTNVTLEVAFCPENLGVAREEIARRVSVCLDQVNLNGFESRQPATLSGGQKQRLAIASVLAAQPSVVCLDEPTTDLDPVGKHEVFAIARELKDEGATLVVVEHETSEVLAASRIVLMDEGEIVHDGPASEVLTLVEKFRELRIMPAQLAELFAELGYPQKRRPLTPDAAEREFAAGGLRVDQEAHSELVAADGERTGRYGEPVIEVRNVAHRYDTGLTAVDDVSLDIRRGEFVAVLGQNGSGKTTLVKHLNGLLKPTAGTVEVDGQDTRKASLLALGERVGYVFQNPDHQIFSDTVFDEVAFALRKRKLAEDEINTRVAEALSAVRLDGSEKEDPFALSKGMRQRVAVASALAVRPDVLILDEPTTGLDYHQQRSMMQLVDELNESGATIIIVTHAMWVVCEHAHRAVVMEDGRITANGTVREVFGDEEAIARAGLHAPPVVSLSNRLGHTALSVAEMRAITKVGGAT